MPSRIDANFPQPTDENEFELMIRDICALVWYDPHTEKYGRRGQQQKGIDVYGRPVDLNGKYRGTQCKLRRMGNQLSRNEIEAEVADARQFPHELDSLIIATTAPRDTHTQILVDQISELEMRSRKVRVIIWFWDNVTEQLAAYPELIVKYYPDFYSNLTTLPLVERLIDKPLQVASIRSSSKDDIKQLEQSLQFRGIRIQVSNGSIIVPAFPAPNNISPDGVLCAFDTAHSNDAALDLLSFAGRLLGYSQQVESGCPIFVLLQTSVTAMFLDSFYSLGGNPHRIQVLAKDVPCSEQADMIFKQVFDFGFYRRGGPATINIAFRTKPGRPEAMLLDLDWQSKLNTNHFPSPSEWKSDFLSALVTVRDQILSQGDRTRVQINCQLPLPAAFAVGLYFNVRIARVGVWARETAVSDIKQQLWLSDASSSNIACIPEWKKPLTIHKESAVVELTSHVSISEAIESYLEESNLLADAWLQLRLAESGQPVTNITENYAVAYANQAGHAIRKMNEQGITDVHLFARIPSPLAVLVGQRLQSCGRIHFYWFDNPTYRYAFTLR